MYEFAADDLERTDENGTFVVTPPRHGEFDARAVVLERAIDRSLDRHLRHRRRDERDADAAAYEHRDRLKRVELVLLVGAHPKAPQVIAVLDWELSTIGDPMADVAHFCVAWDSRPDEYGGIAGLDLAALGLPERGEFLAWYAAAGGRADAFAAFHRIFALFRFAVIFEGIAARAKHGNAASEGAAEVGRLSQNFARRAVEIIAGAAG